MQNLSGTKRKIFDTAVLLFSENGYGNVSMRDIASSIGIQPASIYNHFTGKADLLASIYDFFVENQQAVKPDLEELMKLAETEEPHEVIKKAFFFYDPKIARTMDRITIIAANEQRNDLYSDHIIHDCVFSLPEQYTGPLLRRMIELGRIEPLDVDTFVYTISLLCYSSAILNYSRHPVTMDMWQKVNDMVGTLIKSTGK